MSIALALTLATVTTVQPVCSWDRPGANRYTGSAAAALDRYVDMPAAVRATLKQRIDEGKFDDKVSITRDAIAGKHDYDPAIRDMHFGAASVCASVTRSKWAEARKEPGVVYCVEQHCILVPRICGNVSRISRKPAPAPAPPPVASTLNEPKPRDLIDELRNTDLGLAEPEPANEDIDEEKLAKADTRARKALRAPGPERDAGGYALDDPDSPYLPFPPPTFDYTGEPGVVPMPVPEADTWAMLLAGLGVIGFGMRRARRAHHGVPQRP
ncbi:PEP-CTERM sorting domain-containing protein [Oxalobacteraceae bacterium]|nr:PEP-CTERM sorting domain-containing protein [Oxalobacteraceae bacterium]